MFRVVIRFLGFFSPPWSASSFTAVLEFGVPFLTRLPRLETFFRSLVAPSVERHPLYPGCLAKMNILDVDAPVNADFRQLPSFQHS